MLFGDDQARQQRTKLLDLNEVVPKQMVEEIQITQTAPE
jgi:hypothetical protein